MAGLHITEVVPGNQRSLLLRCAWHSRQNQHGGHDEAFLHEVGILLANEFKLSNPMRSTPEHEQDESDGPGFDYSPVYWKTRSSIGALISTLLNVSVWL